MLVIIITRLHAMYERSRKMLVFLVVIFLTLQIAHAVTTAINSWSALRSGGKLPLYDKDWIASG
jgi:hypothetical protein